jgi:serine protease Do
VTPFNGPVYVIDAVTNNTGAAGGALVTRRGELVGLLGKALSNARNDTWLNYAIPIDELRDTVEQIRGGKFVARSEEQSQPKPTEPLTLDRLGIVLVPDVVDRPPPFVDRVRPGSPAAAAGVRPDDLVVFVGDRLVQSCRDLRAELEYIDAVDEAQLTLLRGPELVPVKLRAPADNF